MFEGGGGTCCFCNRWPSSTFLPCDLDFPMYPDPNVSWWITMDFFRPYPKASLSLESLPHLCRWRPLQGGSATYRFIMPSPRGTDVLSRLPYGNWSKECLKTNPGRESASDVGWVSWRRRRDEERLWGDGQGRTVAAASPRNRKRTYGGASALTTPFPWPAGGDPFLQLWFPFVCPEALVSSVPPTTGTQN